MSRVSIPALTRVLRSEFHTKQLEDCLIRATEMKEDGCLPIIGLLYPGSTRAYTVQCRDALNDPNGVIPARGQRWEPVVTLWW